MSGFDAQMQLLGSRAKEVATTLASSASAQRSLAISEAANSILNNIDVILSANEIDMSNGRDKGLDNAMLDRLFLDRTRIKSIANSLKLISELPDPLGNVLSQWERPSGLQIKRVTTPLGVIGVIYESRPNVTADAGALCLKAGNATILRGGSFISPFNDDWISCHNYFFLSGFDNISDKDGNNLIVTSESCNRIELFLPIKNI